MRRCGLALLWSLKGHAFNGTFNCKVRFGTHGANLLNAFLWILCDVQIETNWKEWHLSLAWPPPSLSHFVTILLDPPPPLGWWHTFWMTLYLRKQISRWRSSSSLTWIGLSILQVSESSTVAATDKYFEISLSILLRIASVVFLKQLLWLCIKSIYLLYTTNSITECFRSIIFSLYLSYWLSINITLSQLLLTLLMG